MSVEGGVVSALPVAGVVPATEKFAAGELAPATEQRTQITTVIRDQHVQPLTSVSFSIAVGTRVPREGIELHALPSRVVSIYPEWRSYRYVLVREQIVIIDPTRLMVTFAPALPG